MSKGKRRVVPGKSTMGAVFVLILSVLLPAVGACEDPDAEASTSSDGATEVVSTTIPDGTDGTDVTGDSTADSDAADDSTTMSTTLASVVIGPTSTGVFQTVPPLSLQPISPAISIDPGLLQIWTRYEEDDSLLEFEPGWETVSSSSASEGAYRATMMGASEPTSVAAYFVGTRIRIIAFKDGVYGQANAYLSWGGAGGWDGLGTWGLDLYSPSLTSSQVVWTSPVLDYGTYALVFNNAVLPSDPVDPINIDAVEVMGVLIGNPGP